MRRWNPYWIAITLAFFFATPTFAQHRFENVSLLPQVYPPQPTVGLAANRPLCSFGSPGQISQYYATDTAALSFCTNTGWVGFTGGGGAVSSVFTRTGAVVAVSGDYTLDQVGNPAAQKTFALGTNNPLGFSSAGVFTTSAQHEYLQSIVGASCPQSTIINSGGTVFVTDAVSGCVLIPAGAGVTQGFANAGGFYIQNNNSSSLGQFGKAIGVAVYGAALCNANNTKCEGFSPQVSSTAGFTGVVMEGTEIGVVPFNTTDTGAGALLSFEGGNTQPTGDNMPAIVVQTPTGSATWTSGLRCDTGSLTGTAPNIFPCVNVGAQASGAGHGSQYIFFNAIDPAAAAQTSYLNLNLDNVTTIGTHSVAVFSPSTDESYAIALNPTATLPVNTLVKIDTANPDAVVICTTTDVLCNGFTSGTNRTGGLCVAGSTVCSVADVPGSKVKAILGTGTCAIGNWVIVDTTTNGDVKCATVQPVAWQGFALAANSTVGTAFDVLVSPGGTSNVNAKTFSTATNCAGVGTAASPSVASCGSAAAGHFSCATNATGATCQVNTTAVTANSEIFVFESDTTVTGTALGVTCNTSTTVLPTSRLLASSVAATSFTINLGTVTTNPACFSYNIVN